jgi:glycosyltransferase involved in cell wall biosynthesis
MVPYEAFLAEKPVVTTTDSGGPLEVVADRRTGLVCEPQADALARACAWLRDNVGQAQAFGREGRSVAERVTWDEAIDRLLAS